MPRRGGSVRPPAIKSATGPLRRALLDEGVHALSEVLARVALQNEVVELGRRGPLHDSSHRLLGCLQRQRRVTGDLHGELTSARLQLLRWHDLPKESDRFPFVRLDEPASEQ